VATIKVHHKTRTVKTKNTKNTKHQKTRKRKKMPKKNKEKKVEETTFKAAKTYVAIVLDKSGSMDSIMNEARTSFNEQVKKIQEESKNLDTRICLTVFNHELDFVKFDEAVDNLSVLEKKDYQPSGWTAFYDAVCTTIRKLEDLPDINEPETAVLMLIITDGLENSSKKYNSKDLSEMIARLKNTERWTFSVMGANIDLEALSVDTGIDKSNMLKFAVSADSVLRGTNKTNAAYGKYFDSRRSLGVKSCNLYNDKDEISDADED